MASTRTVDKLEVALRKFGDDQSSLLDQYERISFEIHLNQAMLRRSLSEPSVHRTFQFHTAPTVLPLPPPAAKAAGQRGTRRGSGFQKGLKKLVKQILRKSGWRKVVQKPKDSAGSWNAYSRCKSMRF